MKYKISEYQGKNQEIRCKICKVMTRETLCNYEQSSLLKRLGFDWHCWCVFERSKTGMFPFRCAQPANFNANTNAVSAPTMDVAHRWLREVMQLLIVINPQRNTEGKISYNYSIFYLEDITPVGYSYELYDQYEIAMSAALDYTIECAVIQYRKQTHNTK